MSNLVILMSDEHNPRYSSVYGHPFVSTPNMAKLAERGTLFLNAYTPSPLCLPARCAFLSGKRVHDIQAYSNCSVNLDSSHETYGASLSKQGIHTVHLGKTHYYARSGSLGFDEIFLPKDTLGPGDANHRRNPLFIRKEGAQRADEFGVGEGSSARDTAAIDAAILWIQTVGAEKKQPWVLVVNIVSPHFPHYAPEKFWEDYRNHEDLPEYGSEQASAAHPHAVSLREHFQTEAFSERQVRGLRRGYYACVSYADHQLGRLMEAVKDAALDDSTNIVYTSDHGEMLGKFGMWWKCSLYEDSVRIPCIAAGPDFKAGTRLAAPVDLHDLQASCFSVTGARRPPDWVGTPLDLITGEDSERPVFSEYHGHGTRSSSYMIRRGQWKYLYHVGAPTQLFDMENDPEELNNRAGQERAVATEMHRVLMGICDPEVEDKRAEALIEQQIAVLGR